MASILTARIGGLDNGLHGLCIEVLQTGDHLHIITTQHGKKKTSVHEEGADMTKKDAHTAQPLHGPSRQDTRTQTSHVLCGLLTQERAK